MCNGEKQVSNSTQESLEMCTRGYGFEKSLPGRASGYEMHSVQSPVSVEEQDLFGGRTAGKELEKLSRSLTAKDAVLTFQVLSLLPEDSMAGSRESSCKHIARNLNCEIDQRPVPPCVFLRSAR